MEMNESGSEATVGVIENEVSRRSQRKRNRSKGGSSSQGSSRNFPQTLTKRPCLENPSQKERRIATNFNELHNILQSPTAAGEEIELRAGIFDGQMTIKGLPEGVRIVGTGPQTIIKATQANDNYIWRIIDTGKGCTVEGLRFEKEGGNRDKEAKGLWISSDGLKVHNVSFLGCHLEADICDAAEVIDVIVESSYYGIILDRGTQHSSVKDASFKSVSTGVGVWGTSNRISHVSCVDVATGICFKGNVINRAQKKLN